MRRYVIDTGVLMLFFTGDERVKPYFEEIDRGAAVGLVSCANLAELYYKVCETLGRDVAELRCHRLLASRIEVVPLDEELALEAGRLKCHYRRLSLADCIALALAKTEGAVLLTTDKELARTREVSVRLFEI